MSFPSFVQEELAYETWPDSDLLGRLNRILLCPSDGPEVKLKQQPSSDGHSFGRRPRLTL